MEHRAWGIGHGAEGIGRKTERIECGMRNGEWKSMVSG
jgi:hypothetical protein